MTIRLKPAVTRDGEVRLMLPAGRHLERDGWFVATDVFGGRKRLLELRVWTPADDGYRVIVLDGHGGEHGSINAQTLQAAEAALTRVAGAQRGYPKPEGRRLVSGGDRDWEIAAELERIDDEEILFVRVWLQQKQAFTVYAIDEARIVRAHAAAATYAKAAGELRDQILR